VTEEHHAWTAPTGPAGQESTSSAPKRPAQGGKSIEVANLTIRRSGGHRPPEKVRIPADAQIGARKSLAAANQSGVAATSIRSAPPPPGGPVDALHRQRIAIGEPRDHLQQTPDTSAAWSSGGQAERTRLAGSAIVCSHSPT